MSIPPKVKSAFTKRINQMNDPKADFIIHFIVVRPAGADDEPRIHLAPKPDGSTLTVFREVYKGDPAVTKAPPAKMITLRGVITQKEGVLRIHPAPDSKVTAPSLVKRAFTDLKTEMGKDSLPTAWIGRLEQSKTLVTPPIDPRKLGDGAPDIDDVVVGTVDTRGVNVDDLPDAPDDQPVQDPEEVPGDLADLTKRLQGFDIVQRATALRDADEKWTDKTRAAARAKLIEALETDLNPFFEQLQQKSADVIEQRRLAEKTPPTSGYEALLQRTLQTKLYVERVIDRVELQLRPAAVDEDHGGVEQIVDEGTADPKLAAMVEAVQKLDTRGAIQEFTLAFNPQAPAKPAVRARARVRLTGIRNSLQRIEIAVDKHTDALCAERNGPERHASKLVKCKELAARLDGLRLKIEDLLRDGDSPAVVELFDLTKLTGPSQAAMDEVRFAEVKTFYNRFDTLVAEARSRLEEASKPSARAELSRGLASFVEDVRKQAEAQLKVLEDAVNAVADAVTVLPKPGQDAAELWLAAHDADARGGQRTVKQVIDEDYVPRRAVGGYALFQSLHTVAREESARLTKLRNELVPPLMSVRVFSELSLQPNKEATRARLVTLAQDNPQALRAMGKTATGARLLDDLVAGLGDKVGKADLPFLKEAFAARFDMDLGGEDLSRRATPKMYKLFSQVPDAHTRDNKNIQSVMRTRKENGGGAYGSNTKKIKIEVSRSGHKAPTVKLKVSERQQKKANFFNHTVLHEIGHGVDEDLQYMTTHMANATYGAWQSSSPDKIAGLIYDQNKTDPAIKDLDETDVKAYFQALLEGKAEAPKTTSDPKHLPTLLQKHALTEVCKLISPTDKKGLWFAGEAAIAKVEKALGGQVAVHSYANEWNLYDADARKRMLRDYQFRAPGEWFAEVYAAYYMGLLNTTDKAWFEKEIHNPAEGQV